MLQHFSDRRHNSTAPDAFVVLVKITIFRELSDAEPASYSPSATHRIYLTGLKYDFEIPRFKPGWPCWMTRIF